MGRREDQRGQRQTRKWAVVDAFADRREDRQQARSRQFREPRSEPAARLVINDDYTDRIEELRDAAAASSKDYSETGFRYLQFLEGMW